jgi:DNA-binding transcriptional ArsR family regulator
MPSRFEYERSIRSSDLPPLSRLLALTLATWADVKTGVIAARHTPSLSTLEEGTGMDRSTVRRHLNKLEAAGWVKRARPTVEAARSKKARTRYRLLIPKGMSVPDMGGDELEAENTEPRGTQPLAAETLGAQDPQPRGTQPLELGAENPISRGTVPLKSSYGPNTSVEDQQASPAALARIGDRPRIPEASRPLVDAITAAGMPVGWDLESAEWFLIEALIKRCGADALVISARSSWQGARTQPRSGRYFIPAWRALPDAPDPTHDTSAVNGQVLPLGTSRQQQETDDWYARSMARARARSQQETS